MLYILKQPEESVSNGVGQPLLFVPPTPLNFLSLAVSASQSLDKNQGAYLATSRFFRSFQYKLVLFISGYCSLFGDIRDYLQPVINKPESSGIKNIDLVYLINLDERPLKLRICLEQLSPYNIYPCRFSAINGWNLSLEAIDELGVKYETWMGSDTDHWGTYYKVDGDKSPIHEIVSIPGKTYYCHCMALGSIGCVLSHMSVLQDALNSGYETIWIIEDDIEIIQDPHLLSQMIEELDRTVGRDGWDVLFTDQDTKNTEGNYVRCCSYAWRPNYTPANTNRFAERRDVGTSFRQIGSRYGSYSMILRRSGIKKILNFLKCYQVFLPYDMEYTQPANIRLFAVKEDIVSTQPRAPSDNGSPNYILNPIPWQ